MGQAVASSLHGTVQLFQASAHRTMRGAAVPICTCRATVQGRGREGQRRESAPVQGCLPSAHTCREVEHKTSSGLDRVYGRNDRSAQCDCTFEHSQSQWLTLWYHSCARTTICRRQVCFALR